MASQMMPSTAKIEHDSSFTFAASVNIPTNN